MPFESSPLFCAIRRKLLPTSLVAALVLPAAVAASALHEASPLFDLAQTWYPLRPVVTAPEVGKRSAQSDKERPIRPDDFASSEASQHMR
jgi:hypothetical protein